MDAASKNLADKALSVAEVDDLKATAAAAAASTGLAVDGDITAIDPEHRPVILQSLTSDQLRQLERKLVRKLDMRLLPILILMFILNILDRNAIGNARLGGLEDDLGLTDSQYQTAVMAVWAGYISMMIPSNMLLSKFRPSIYLPTVVIIWGIAAGSSGFTQSFGGIIATRLLTGITEAPYFAGCIFLLSCWYKRSELPFRIAIFYGGYTLSSAFGGLVAAGIVGGMDGLGGYRSWRWLFIVEGALTIVSAFPAYYLLLDYPATTKSISPEMAALAEWRLSLEADGEEDDADGSAWEGLKQAVLDPKVWLLVLIAAGVVVGFSFTYYFPSLVATLGYSNIITLLLTAPPYFIAFLFSLFNSWHSGTHMERGWHIVGTVAVSIVGQIIAMTTHNIGVRYFAFILCCLAFSAFQIMLSWISSTIARPKAKRAVAVAMCNAISNTTNIGSAYLYPDSDGPLFQMGGTVLTISLAVCGISSLVLKFWLQRLNKQAERNGSTFRYIT